ncbi:MAG: FAD-binding oxidoreductase [Alteromonadaceae bacterium]|nr:MAG: FAD-binding oxidoreductase [Alteromonadaceae bacterium]
MNNKTESPFHSGEMAIQTRLGVREQMERFGRQVIRDFMPEQHQQFYHSLPYVFVGHADSQGWPWASILFNKPGFITSESDQSFSINSRPVRGDPIEQSLIKGTRFGVLGIELHTRRRNRMSAHINDVSDGAIHLTVDQTFGNCPQYIQHRELYQVDASEQGATELMDIQNFDAEAQALIAQSDTFFVASFSQKDSENHRASEGADVSHRGGKPGFVRVDNARSLTIPDYLGNSHFNTLGNFVENPKAGLLFLDFEKGHILSVTGTVEILWDSDEAKHFNGAERLWRFHIDHGRWLKNSLPLRWKLQEFSPNSLLTGSWAEAENLKEAEQQQHQWQAYRVMKVEQESELIRSYYLSAQQFQHLKFKPGQYLTLKARIDGQEQVRTYTVSSAPEDNFYRISVKHEQGREQGSDIQPKGLFSSYMHEQINEGDIIFGKAPSGNFTYDASEEKPAVLLSAGVGITPMVSMARHTLIDGFRTRKTRALTLISAAKNADQRAFFDELNDFSVQSGGRIRSLWALSDAEGLLEGKDFHLQGRISKEFLQSALVLDNYEFYLCGPTAFMQSMYDILLALGVADTSIYAESFGPASLKRRPTSQFDGSRKTEPETPPAKAAVVTFTRSQGEQSWREEDGSLLAFSEAHGYAPESGCRSGRCGACKTKLIAGAVSYISPPEASLEEGEVLLCCAVPAASEGDKVVKVEIDL